MKKPNKREGSAQMKSSAEWRKPALWAIILIPWVIMLAFVFRSHGRLGFLKSSKPITHETKPGPWGKLQAVHFHLKAPEKVTLDLCRTNLPTWFFGSTS